MNRPKDIRQRWRASRRVPSMPPARIILASPTAASRTMVAMKNIMPAGTPSMWLPGLPSAVNATAYTAAASVKVSLELEVVRRIRDLGLERCERVTATSGHEQPEKSEPAGNRAVLCAHWGVCRVVTGGRIGDVSRRARGARPASCHLSSRPLIRQRTSHDTARNRTSHTTVRRVMARRLSTATAPPPR